MIKKKICLLGYFAVGKTSLARRFVYETFSEKYHTTIGVKIDKKEVVVNGNPLQMLIWDIHGEDRFQKVQKSYLLGAAGYFLVVDATRAESLEAMMQLNDLVAKTVGQIPFMVLLNKWDLINERAISVEQIVNLGIDKDHLITTSAKTGEGVEEAFIYLAKKLI